MEEDGTNSDTPLAHKTPKENAKGMEKEGKEVEEEQKAEEEVEEVKEVEDGEGDDIDIGGGPP